MSDQNGGEGRKRMWLYCWVSEY